MVGSCDFIMVKLRRYDHLGTARFVTFPTYYRKRLLLEDPACQALAFELSRLRTEAQVKLLGYVFMPEHVHLVLLPPDGAPLGKLIGQLKARSAQKIAKVAKIKLCLASGESPTSVRVWQARCYDHNCRTQMATREKIEYCHKNPVTRGLVTDASQWRWSSHNWYQGEHDVPIEIDGFDAI